MPRGRKKRVVVSSSSDEEAQEDVKPQQAKNERREGAAAAAAVDVEMPAHLLQRTAVCVNMREEAVDAVTKDEPAGAAAASASASAASASVAAASSSDAVATSVPGEPALYVPREIAPLLKAHQVAGVRFLWRAVVAASGGVAAARRQQANQGKGCLLAHFCGLGKSVQVISFLYVYLACIGRHALVVAPVNTLANWIAEFEKWLKPKNRLDVFSLDSCAAHKGRKVQVVRLRCLQSWAKSGGVMIVGYEGLRHIVQANSKHLSAKQNAEAKKLMLNTADIVIADEGHRIKNAKSSLAQAMQQLRTHRRIVLTGTPLQNNTTEYHAMVDFIRPGFLGSVADFNAKFDAPIRAGQCLDSSPDDVALMKKRVHVLHKKLEPLVHRVDYSMLRAGSVAGIEIAEEDNSDRLPAPAPDPTSIQDVSKLPNKHEYVIFVRLSPFQRVLYARFIATHRMTLLKSYHALSKIWNHPSCLESTQAVLDADSDLSDDDESEDRGRNKKKSKAKGQRNSGDHAAGGAAAAASANGSGGADGQQQAWYGDLLSASSGYRSGRVEDSGKLLVCIFLLASAFRAKEKTLIFSQSLDMLDLLENVLESYFGLVRDEGFFRLDGSTSSASRHEHIQMFNDESSEAKVFLISTRAGCLGVNLVGASRVILYDASWNPSKSGERDCIACFAAGAVTVTSD